MRNALRLIGIMVGGAVVASVIGVLPALCCVCVILGAARLLCE